MTPSQKPKLIEIDEKNNSLFPRKVSRTLPIIALAVTVSIIGIGSIYAHPTVESPASALEITAPEEFDTSEISFDPTVASVEIPLIGTLPTVGEEDDELLGYDSDDDDLDESDEDDDDDESDEDEVEEDDSDDDEGDDD